MKLLLTVSIIFLYFLFSSATHAESLNSDFIFKSLDGKITHKFFKSGEYSGSFNYTDRTKDYLGVYRYGEGICWQNNWDGSKGRKGNIIIHYNNQQCCISLQKIGNSYTTTFLFSDPPSMFHDICVNSVLKQTDTD